MISYQFTRSLFDLNTKFVCASTKLAFTDENEKIEFLMINIFSTFLSFRQVTFKNRRRLLFRMSVKI